MLFDVWYVTGLILLIFPISNHLQDCSGLLCLVPRVVAYIYDRVDCIKNFLNKNVCESCSFWPFTDIIPLLTSFTEVEQEAVMQENAMLQVNNVWLSVENTLGSCSGSMVVVVNVSSLAVVNWQDTTFIVPLSMSPGSHLTVKAYMKHFVTDLGHKTLPWTS